MSVETVYGWSGGVLVANKGSGVEFGALETMGWCGFIDVVCRAVHI